MHSNKIFKFETEIAAKEFVAEQKKNIWPHEDTRIHGPFFMDENVIFKNMEWANTGKTWWQVDIDTYS
jgi:hypothetical protein